MAEFDPTKQLVIGDLRNNPTRKPNDYIVRALLDFDWADEPTDEGKRFLLPQSLPVSLADFRLEESPNASRVMVYLGWE